MSITRIRILKSSWGAAVAVAVAGMFAVLSGCVVVPQNGQQVDVQAVAPPAYPPYWPFYTSPFYSPWYEPAYPTYPRYPNYLIRPGGNLPEAQVAPVR